MVQTGLYFSHQQRAEQRFQEHNPLPLLWMCCTGFKREKELVRHLKSSHSLNLPASTTHQQQHAPQQHAPQQQLQQLQQQQQEQQEEQQQQQQLPPPQQLQPEKQPPEQEQQSLAQIQDFILVDKATDFQTQ